MSTDVTREATRASLEKGSTETSQHFNQVVDEIAWETTDGLDEFCALCEEMGGAGWKSYESLNAYLDIALQLGLYGKQQFSAYDAVRFHP